MDLSVKVTEAPTGSIMLGGGYGSYDKLMINGSVSDTNIFGSGLTLSLSGDLSKRSNRYEVALKNPAINDSDYNGEVEAHSTKIEYRRSQYDSDVKTKGFSIAAGKEVVRNTYVGARYGLDFISEVYNYIPNSNVPINKRFLDQDYTNSSITPYVNYDSTNDFYFPTAGIKAGASVEYAGVS